MKLPIYPHPVLSTSAAATSSSQTIIKNGSKKRRKSNNKFWQPIPQVGLLSTNELLLRVVQLITSLWHSNSKHQPLYSTTSKALCRWFHRFKTPIFSEIRCAWAEECCSRFFEEDPRNWNPKKWSRHTNLAIDGRSSARRKKGREQTLISRRLLVCFGEMTKGGSFGLDEWCFPPS